MNESDKRRWFRVSPKGLVPRVGKILLGPKTMPIGKSWARDSSMQAPPADRSTTWHSEFLHGNTRRFCTLAWTRGFRIGISYEGTIQRSSVSGGLSRPKHGSSLLSRDR
jgi:hypothetical protein